MVPQDRFLEIAKGLLEKTKRGQVNWRPTPGQKDSYSVRLPNSELRLEFGSPPTEPDFVQLWVLRPDGKEAGHWLAEEGTDHWELALSLYSEVDRRITGWDKVLEDVEKFIAQ